MLIRKCWLILLSLRKSELDLDTGILFVVVIVFVVVVIESKKNFHDNGCLQLNHKSKTVY